MELKPKLLLCFAVFGGSSAAIFNSSNHGNSDSFPPPQSVQGDVGEALYLSPYIESGDIATAKQLAQVTDRLDGLGSLQPLSYSGYITVDQDTDAQNHLFFWFFPASEVTPSSAPVVIWLQGGPGSSSLYGLFEINGPISAVFDDNGGVTGVLNDYSWHRRANMIYIDQPVGAGYSHTYNDAFVTSWDEAGRDLYSMLKQWFMLFPEYQTNDFFAFGESTAGKFVPVIAEKIHQENQNSPEVFINLRGFATGNPKTDSSSNIWAEYLYQLGLIDEIDRERFLEMEAEFFSLLEQERWAEANYLTDLEIDEAMARIGCTEEYDFTKCESDPEGSNFKEYVQYDSTRLAIHVGNSEYETQYGDVYFHLYEDIPKTVKDRVETLLENGYDYMLYSGGFDIVCHHSGSLAYLESLQWSGQSAYLSAGREVYYVNGETGGYITSANNMKVFFVRNAGHAAPRYQPEVTLEMFTDFINGNL